MTDSRYEVIFRGDLCPGSHINDVKQKLATLFKTDQNGIAHLFTGKLAVIKSGLDETTAQRYLDAMKRAGALANIRLQKGNNPDPSDTYSRPGELTIAPLGADMLPHRVKPEDRIGMISTDHLSLADAGVDVLQPDEKTPFVPRDIDTSHLDFQ